MRVTCGSGATPEALHRHPHRHPERHGHGDKRAERLLDRHAAKMREDQIASTAGASLLRKMP